MKRKNLAPGALTAPLPPCMVTVGDMENNNILTVAWTGILATVPPKTYISVRPSRHSHKMLGVGKEFVINLPPATLAKEVDFVGIYTGAKMDKFEKCALTRVKSEKVSPPTVAECPIALECRVADVMPMGSHDVFIADIVGISVDDSLLDEAGKIHLERAGLIAYAHGEYYALGEKLGKFGFSAAKETKAQIKKNTSVSSKTVKNQEKTSDTVKKEPYYAKFVNKKGTKNVKKRVNKSK